MTDATLLQGAEVVGGLAGTNSAVVTGGTGVTDAGVIKLRRNPRAGGVTVTTGVSGRNVVGIFAGGNGAVVTA